MEKRCQGCALDRDKIIESILMLRKLIFPGYFEEIAGNAEDYKKALRYNAKSKLKTEVIKLKASPQLIDQLFDKLEDLREALSTDVEATLSGDPAADDSEEVITTYPGIFAMTLYRIAHELYLLDIPVIPRIITEYAHSKVGIDIHPGAQIGRYFMIDHGTGLVIGQTAVIGDRVRVYQGVTIGALSLRDGITLKGIKRHPTIGNNVTIYAGASLLGGETVIGDNVTVGGNVFLTASVAANHTVTLKRPELEFKPHS